MQITYFYIQKHYRPVSRDLQRLESLSRSPIFAQFSETLAGVATLRAYGRQQAFLAQNARRLNDSNRAYYHMQVSVHGKLKSEAWTVAFGLLS